MLLPNHQRVRVIASAVILLSMLASACRSSDSKGDGTPSPDLAATSATRSSAITAEIAPTKGANPAISSVDQNAQGPVCTAAEPLTPEIVAFEIVPGDRLSFGEIVTATWSVHNALKVILCYQYSTGTPWNLREQGGGCFTPLPAAGSQLLSLTPYEHGDAYYAHFWLEATSGRTDADDPNALHDPVHDRVDAYVPLTCADAWFMPNPPRWCPQGPPRSMEATAQTFENGIMVYVPSCDGTPPNSVTAYFQDPTRSQNRYMTFMAVFAEEPDPELIAPPGLLVPDDLFYPAWRGMRDGRYGVVGPLRDVMGWATAAPVSFTQIIQQEEGPASHDPIYKSMPGGSIYQLGDNVWSVWE
jgi:hypothetical protein